jgi:glycosyltransferase involved in cell wall biosynthesis
MKPIAVLSINASWNVINFRAGLVRALHDSGMDIVALAPTDEYSGLLEDLGASHYPIEMDRRGTSPARDALLVLRYYMALRHIKPAVYLGYTAKPNTYGSLAAHALGIPVINNVAGLGVAFLKQDWLNQVIRQLYRMAFRRSQHVFFQNPDDLALFADGGLVDPGRTSLLPGSGIDLRRFTVQSSPRHDDEGFSFLMVTRLLWAKGVKEFVQAAAKVKAARPGTRFKIAGIVEVDRPEAVPLAQVQEWQEAGLVEYLGAVDDVRAVVAEADCVVLPSFYPEGTPRSLLEAAAMGKPLITCDVPGCREVVRDGRNGYLCAPRDSASLAAAMLRILDLSPEGLGAMGRASRREAEERFDEQIVLRRYLEEIGKVVALSPPRGDGLDPPPLRS